MIPDHINKIRKDTKIWEIRTPTVRKSTKSSNFYKEIILDAVRNVCLRVRKINRVQEKYNNDIDL